MEAVVCMPSLGPPWASPHVRRACIEAVQREMPCVALTPPLFNSQLATIPVLEAAVWEVAPDGDGDLLLPQLLQAPPHTRNSRTVPQRHGVQTNDAQTRGNAAEARPPSQAASASSRRPPAVPQQGGPTTTPDTHTHANTHTHTSKSTHSGAGGPPSPNREPARTLCAIISGSVSPTSSTMTGAPMEICWARVPSTRARSYLVMYRAVMRLTLGLGVGSSPGREEKGEKKWDK